MSTAPERQVKALERFSNPNGGLNILTPAIARRWVITEGMIQDFIEDPVLGVKVMFGEDMDVYQRVRMKLFWTVPRVIDSSGLSSAKTKCLWWVSNLRCLLISDHVAGVYYQTFSQGQGTYWKYYAEAARRSPIFRHHLGVMNAENTETKGKAQVRGPSCWTCSYKNASMVMMPAPGFLQDSKSQASIRLNDLYIDEWTKIESTGTEGIDQQLIGRATRACFNQHHRFWCNKHIFLGTAEDSMHPAAERYNNFNKQIAAGSPDYATPSFSFKDYSDRIMPKTGGLTYKEKLREVKVMRDMKINKSKAGYLQEALGVWQKNGKVLYNGEFFDTAYDTGQQRGTRVLCHKDEDWSPPAKRNEIRWFLGADPAKADQAKADDGALVVLRAEPKVPQPVNVFDWKLDFVWAYKVRKADGPQWSGIIHRKDKAFNFDQIEMDPGGGGNWIRPELRKAKQIIQDQEVTVTPIGCKEDEADMPVFGKLTLSMFKLKDAQIEAMWGHMQLKGTDALTDVAHQEFCDAWEKGYFGLPPKVKTLPREEVAGWTDERRWAALLLEVMVKQLQSINVQTNPDGSTYRSKNQARSFSAKGRKDFAYAAMFAYVAFLVWFKSNADDFKVNPEDEEMCG